MEPLPEEMPGPDAHRWMADFLARDTHPEGSLLYFEFLGFVWAVASAPALIPFDDWLGAVFGDGGPALSDEEEASQLFSAAVAIFNEALVSFHNGEAWFPEGCEFRESLMDNFGSDAPMSLWSRGFYDGHDWLSELWEELPEEREPELSAVLLILAFWADRTAAEELTQELITDEVTFDDVAAEMKSLCRYAALEYADLGWGLADALAEDEPAEGLDDQGLGPYWGPTIEA